MTIKDNDRAGIGYGLTDLRDWGARLLKERQGRQLLEANLARIRTDSASTNQLGRLRSRDNLDHKRTCRVEERPNLQQSGSK
jgi:hypothetical protein